MDINIERMCKWETTYWTKIYLNANIRLKVHIINLIYFFLNYIETNYSKQWFNYVSVIVKGLYFISLKKGKIGSMVIDGNTAQIKEFSPLWKKFVFYSKEIDNPENLNIILYLCHRCYNAYKYQDEHNGEMVSIVKELGDVAIKYNTSKDDSFPILCEARWVYDFYIVSYKKFIYVITPKEEHTIVQHILKCYYNIELLKFSIYGAFFFN